MTVAGAVMAHPRRGAWAEELAGQLDIPIVWDEVNDRHDTGLRCLLAGLEAERDVTHWLVVQDDAVVCRDLIAGLERATEVSEDRLVALYIGNFRNETVRLRERVRSSRSAGRPWLSMPGPWWGVGIVVPTVHLPSLTSHYERSTAENYDRRIQMWSAAMGVECWYTMPNLVQHRSGPENPSLVPGRTSMQRRSQWFIGEDVSALSVDWTVLPMREHDRWRHLVTGRVLQVRPLSAQAARMQASGLWEPIDPVAR